MEIALIIYVVISLASFVVLTILFLRKKKNHSEGFRKCICSQGQCGREQDCQDTVTVNNLYVTNKLTEFSKLPSKGWSTVSPGDINFPEFEGCDNSDIEKGWASWDFTDFGNN